MSGDQRTRPAPDAGERANLEGWLDFYRATLASKCVGLTDEQLSTACAAPSTLTLMGLVQHEAEVERNWFRRVLLGEDVPSIYGPRSVDGHSGGFDVAPGTSFETVHRTWQDEIAVAKANCAGRELDDTSPFMDGTVTLRWIYTHLIAEYARHCGHADLLRERIDGTTGV